MLVACTLDGERSEGLRAALEEAVGAGEVPQRARLKRDVYLDLTDTPVGRVIHLKHGESAFFFLNNWTCNMTASMRKKTGRDKHHCHFDLIDVTLTVKIVGTTAKLSVNFPEVGRSVIEPRRQTLTGTRC